MPVAHDTVEPPAVGTRQEAPPPVKPRLRGVLHLMAFLVSLVTGPALVLAAPSGGPTVAVMIYAASMSALFGISALLHRRTWTPQARRIMRRVDHSMIFFLIAGTYTAIAPLVLRGTTALVILAVVWIGGAVGVVIELFWLEAPKWAVVLPYVVVGWTAVAALPQLGSALGGAGLGLMIGGGLAYTAGAAVYALRRPNPWPTLFGYHEVFHGLTVVAAAAHYLLVARYVLPLA
ncbi:MAG: hemolysin [Acidimicrobiaceae bacterium]|nr:hemolysin [Acidimicrobiaceae bacterium]